MTDTAAEQSKPSSARQLTLEAWSQGFMVGALIIMAGITLANMRKGVLLHKLILIELAIAIPNGFFIFFNPPQYGWFLSATVVPLITSWTLHNIIAWMKSKPFLGPRGNLIYIGSIILVQPYWILEIYANFAFFNGVNARLFPLTRPYEALFRYLQPVNPLGEQNERSLANLKLGSDPWWIFTIVNLFWNIKFRYDLRFIEIIQVSPRFAILLLCMTLSVIWIVVDLLSVTPVILIGVINPFWKFAFVFKCFTDSIILDDFKSALDKLSRHRRTQILPFDVLPDALSAQGFRDSQTGTNYRRTYGSLEDGVSLGEIQRKSEKKGKDSDLMSLCSPAPVMIHVEHGGRSED
ncbi:hypothetical protein NLU13_3861 [Sarocladium strictum]|uniref:Uncharacterized protein n=1 Tax=Sarocladium strictum TaxID=5046 RepID=A0AA39GHU2_SARSR|nr:hypothetical protein NLU13_3861 [Sarocladium strictum]